MEHQTNFKNTCGKIPIFNVMFIEKKKLNESNIFPKFLSIINAVEFQKKNPICFENILSYCIINTSIVQLILHASKRFSFIKQYYLTTTTVTTKIHV